MIVTAALTAAVLAGNPQVYSFDVNADAEVELSIINGSIDVRREGTGKVRIEAEIPASSGKRGTWTVEVKGHPEKVSAKVCCGPCSDQHQSCDEGEVRLRAIVPERSPVEVGGVTAKVDVRGGSGELSVSTVSGPVSVQSTSGEVSVNSVSADVKLKPAEVKDISVSTVSGDVRLALPEGTDARIHYSTMSGEGPKKATIGRGTNDITVSTLSGDFDVTGAR